MRHHEIGNAQAWLYNEDRTLMLWECFTEQWCRGPNPSEDEALLTLWTGFERVLLEQLPTTERIVTTWEDLYERPVWQQFLEVRGYRPWTPGAFLKELAR